jgi:hypothetical protein
MKYRRRIILGLILSPLCWQGSVEAGYSLSFNSSSYSVGSGRTVQVQVLLSQTPDVTQISPTNPLIGAGIQLSFNNPASAAVLSTSNIAGNTAAFDSIVPGLSSTQATLAENAFLSPGVSTLPGLIGTFTFTGLGFGTNVLVVAPIGPGSSFVAQGGVLSPQPTSATAILSVVPEPSSLVLILTGGPLLCGGLVLRRVRSLACPPDHGQSP